MEVNNFVAFRSSEKVNNSLNTFNNIFGSKFCQIFEDFGDLILNAEEMRMSLIHKNDFKLNMSRKSQIRK